MSSNNIARFVICICLVNVLMLFSGGCSRQRQAVELYIDAAKLAEDNKKEQAIEKLNTSIKWNKHFSPSYSLLGQIYSDANNYEKSVESYKKAIELNPWSFRDYFNLGKVNQRMKKSNEAVDAYVKASELKPDYLEAYIGAAECYYEIKDYNSALVCCNNALGRCERVEKTNPDMKSELQKLLGDIYASTENREQAITAYEKALEVDANNPEVMTSLAVAYLRDNRNDSAKELLISVTEMQPRNNNAYQYLGYCYLQLKDVEKAIDSYSKAIELNGTDWQAHRGLGVAYMLKSIGNSDESLKSKAVHQWRRSLEINPEQARRERLLRLIEKYSK
jgi:tetratricopeptide (TPR) repeat protein